MKIRTLIILAAVLLALTAGRCLASGKDGVAVYVYGEPVMKSEISADEPYGGGLADRVRYAVTSRALARQAMLLGLDESREVEKELERHRRYVLMREVIEHKRRELGKSVEVSDEEASEFARRMCYTVSYVKSEFGERREAEAFMEKAVRNRTAVWESEYTVVACEGAGLRMLDSLFRLEPGQMDSFGRGNRHYVIKVMEKEKTTEPEDLPGWDEIREYLARKKVDQAMEDWLESVFQRAEVRYMIEVEGLSEGSTKGGAR